MKIVQRIKSILNFKYKKETAAFIAAWLLLIAAVSGCSSSRNAALSVVDEPAASTVQTTNYRYSKAGQPNLNLKPILDEQCARCHNSDAGSKLRLTTYLEVYTAGVLVKRAVQPGGAMQQYVPFDYQKIMNWQECGMPE